MRSFCGVCGTFDVFPHHVQEQLGKKAQRVYYLIGGNKVKRFCSPHFGAKDIKNTTISQAKTQRLRSCLRLSGQEYFLICPKSVS